MDGGSGAAEGSSYRTRPLEASTWDAFAELVERNNGVYGGCWCIAFHSEYQRGVSDPRTLKEELVRAGRAHAALVFDGAEAVAWCEYGPPAELSNIYHRKEYEAGLDRLPDYRLTCFFVDRRYRRKGSPRPRSAALELIARAGGGVVEAYPRDTAGKKTSASFLYNGTRSMFEDAGFRYDRPKGSFNCVMITTVPPA